jgi:23S rRNA pseudouridine1911/1915/1917 synthase
MEANYRDGAPAAGDDEDVAAVDAPETPEALEHEVREHVVGAAEHGARLDKTLVLVAPEFSRSHLQALIADGLVQVDGRPEHASSRRLRAGCRVRVELRPTAESLAFRPEVMALPIVHEDDQVLVIDKPAGLVVHPAAGNWSGTLLNGLLAHHAAAASLPRAGIVHRLDKDTSGLMVVGKTLEAVTALARAIAAREVRRVYLALAHGEMKVAEERWIDAPIGRDPGSRLRMAVVGSGRPAQTAVQPLATGAACTALRCRLHTGRTHQIRVHLASIGHPLVGDALYGGRELFGLRRQALHAVSLGFEHPASLRRLEFRAPPPPDFGRAWREVSDEPAQ